MYRYLYCTSRVIFCSPDAPLRRAPDARDVLQPDHRVAAPFGSDKAHRELSRRGGGGPRGGWVRFHPRRCALHVARLNGRVARARRGASPAHHCGVRHLGKPPAVLRRGLGEQAGNAVRLENRRVGVGAAVAAEHAAVSALGQVPGEGRHLNLLGTPLKPCSSSDQGSTGWTRSGSCAWSPDDSGYHEVRRRHAARPERAPARDRDPHLASSSFSTPLSARF